MNGERIYTREEIYADLTRRAAEPRPVPRAEEMKAARAWAEKALRPTFKALGDNRAREQLQVARRDLVTFFAWRGAR